jgi:prepilin-type N-terminal cleavage/methylation domain-containing protein
MKITLRGRRAFTLVEVLVAMTVLVLMAVLILQLTDATNRSSQTSARSVDASLQARIALDRIGADLASLMQRPDVVLSASNSGNTNSLLFLSSVQSASESGWPATVNRGVSALAYQVAASTYNQNRLCLQRGTLPFQWTDSGYAGLGASGYPTALQASQTPTSAEYDILSPGVIAMTVGFQLYPDNLPATLSDGTAIANSRGQIVYTPPMTPTGVTLPAGANPYPDMTRVSAIVVAVVAIDLTNLQLLNTTQVAALSSQFTTPTMNTLPATLWEPIAENAATLQSSLSVAVPLPVRQSLRVLQRFYPIATFGRR